MEAESALRAGDLAEALTKALTLCSTDECKADLGALKTQVPAEEEAPAIALRGTAIMRARMF